jgi:tryptophan synthase beta chain
MSQVLPLPNRRNDDAATARADGLREALRRNPDDRVARIKLLELLYREGDEHEFLREAALFRNGLNGNLDTPDWKSIQTIGLRMFPASPVFAVTPSPERHRRIGEDPKMRPHFEALARSYEQLRGDTRFLNDLDRELLFIARRPTPLAHARQLSAHFGGAQIYFKREDLAPAGTQLQIAVVAQALVAQRLGKTTLVTGTVYGQRGVLVAETAARLGLKAVVYMDQRQMARERTNVFRMWLSGADVRAVDSARLRNHDVRESAVEHWKAETADTLLVMGLDHGPEPYPTMAREAAGVSGREIRRQLLSFSRLSPDLLVARGGNNADALGVFQPFVNDAKVRLVCVEGRTELPALLPAGSSAAATAELSPVQQQLSGAILADSEYPAAAREQSWLKGTGRVEYHRIEDDMVRDTIALTARLEGLIPAIETAHAVAWACRHARSMKRDESVVVALCERADKDILKIGRSMGVPL